MRSTSCLLPHIQLAFGSQCLSDLTIIWGDNAHKDDLSVPYYFLAPQYKDLDLHATIVNFLDLVIICSTSDILHS